jgi:nascent polypeptide-associated complex subunit beta
VCVQAFLFSVFKVYNKYKMTEADLAAARQRMIAKRFGGASTSTGGKGSVRRKKKVASRSAAAQSDAKLGSTLKKLGATNIPGIEEVNLFKEDGKVIHFVNPKVQASIGANTYIISGPSETKPLQELLPSIVSQLGMDNLSQLQNLAAQAGPGAAGAMPTVGDDDDDVPDLVEGNFEEVSEQS